MEIYFAGAFMLIKMEKYTLLVTCQWRNLGSCQSTARGTPKQVSLMKDVIMPILCLAPFTDPTVPAQQISRSLLAQLSFLSLYQFLVSV
jgi:hypothetical protein